MKNRTFKIAALVIAAVLVIAVSVCAGFFIATRYMDRSLENGASVSEKNSESVDNSPSTTSGTSSAVSETYGEPVNDSQVARLLLGKWTDSANLSGYEFLSDGLMKVTYFNMSTLNLDDVIEGTLTGTYSLKGDKLTISYTAYSKAVENVYTVKIDENILYLTDASGDEAMYMRQGAKPESKMVDKELLGKWSSNLSGFEFKEDGTVIITYINLESMGIKLPISGTAEGIYTVDGNNLEIKYSIYSGLIEKNYTYSIEGKVLTLTEKGSASKGTYVKGND